MALAAAPCCFYLRENLKIENGFSLSQIVLNLPNIIAEISPDHALALDGNVVGDTESIPVQGLGDEIPRCIEIANKDKKKNYNLEENLYIGEEDVHQKEWTFGANGLMLSEELCDNMITDSKDYTLIVLHLSFCVNG